LNYDDDEEVAEAVDFAEAYVPDEIEIDDEDE
jgi:hypothetical protein